MVTEATEAGSAHFAAAVQHHLGLIREVFFDRFTDEELEVIAGFWTWLNDEDAQPPPRGAR